MLLDKLDMSMCVTSAATSSRMVLGTDDSASIGLDLDKIDDLLTSMSARAAAPRKRGLQLYHHSFASTFLLLAAQLSIIGGGYNPQVASPLFLAASALTTRATVDPETSEPIDLDALTAAIDCDVNPRRVIVDCTASEAVADR